MFKIKTLMDIPASFRTETAEQRICQRIPTFSFEIEALNSNSSFCDSTTSNKENLREN